MKWFLDDTLIGVGLKNHSHRYLDAKRITYKVREKYKQEPDAVGHSLGGFLASNSGTKGKVVNYNALVPLYEVNKTIPKNHIHIRTKEDIASLPSLLQKDKYKNVVNIKNKYKDKNIIKNLLNTHSLKNL